MAFEDKRERDFTTEEDPESKKIIKVEDPNWCPIKYKVRDGKKILILGNFEMTAEEFKEMVMAELSEEELEVIKQHRYEVTSDDAMQYVE